MADTDSLLGISPDPVRFDEAIAAIRRKVPMTDDVWSELEQDELEFAFTVADVAQLDLVVDVYEAIERAVRDGTTLEDFKADVGDGLEEAWGEENPARVEAIFRTNVMGAYNSGRYAAAQQVKDERPYWRFDGPDDSRTSKDICAPIIRAGVILPADHPWWQTHYPPLHVNCRHRAASLTKEQAEAQGITESPPHVDVPAGFGQAPSGGGGSDWAPDPEDYPGELGADLDDRMAEDAA